MHYRQKKWYKKKMRNHWRIENSLHHVLDEILEDMEEKADHTYFSDWTVDPFSYGNSPIYSQLLPLDIKKEIAPSPKKGFFRFMKKR